MCEHVETETNESKNSTNVKIRTAKTRTIGQDSECGEGKRNEWKKVKKAN